MRAAFALAALTTLVFVAYAPSLQGGWLLWDDASYVYRNELVTSCSWPRIVREAFSTFQCSNYHPLTMISHALLWHLAGEEAFWHRLANLVLHVANSFLVYLVLRGLTRHDLVALGAAGWFAVHPALTSAVAWIAERKEVLAALGYLMTVWIWTGRQVKPWNSFWATAASALALLSKPTAVTLPVVLLFWDNYVRKRWDFHRAVALAMVAAGAAAIAILTLAAQAETAIRWLEWDRRVAAAAHSLPWYVTRWLVPSRLSPHHPVYSHWTSWDGHAWTGAALLLLWLAVVWRWRGQRPVVAWGLTWSLATLLPISGLIPIGRAAVAERYLYLMATGWLAASAYVVAHRLRQPVPRWELRYASAVGSLAAIVWLVLTTQSYAKAWTNDELLWKRVLAHHPTSSLAKLNLGAYYAQLADRPQEARRWFEAIAPDDPDGQFALARVNLLVLDLQQRPTDPVLLRRLEQCAEGTLLLCGQWGSGTLRLGPVERRLAREAALQARLNAARMLLRSGRLAAAERQLRRALDLNPADPEALYLLALTLLHRGQSNQAVHAARQLLEQPGVPEELRDLAAELAATAASSDEPGTESAAGGHGGPARVGLRSF